MAWAAWVLIMVMWVNVKLTVRPFFAWMLKNFLNLKGDGNSHNVFRDMSNIFVTSKKWENLGGVTAMILSTWLGGSPEIKVHGPKGTALVYANADNSDNSLKFKVISSFSNGYF